jgi:L-2-hydroxyglutarate oxidase
VEFDITIVGGGIVGLATAYQLNIKEPNLKILLLEKEESVASHQTGNNSGVIHSGIYYKPGSLKAKNCIDGYHQLIKFAKEFSIPFELCGKVIVATKKEQLPQLKMLFGRGKENRLDGLRYLNSRDELNEHEPHVNGLAGIFVPQTGIIDYKAMAKQMAKQIMLNGVEIRVGERVINMERDGSFQHISTIKSVYRSKFVINCAGLQSDRVSRMTTEELNLKIIPFRGEYYELKEDKQYLVKNLIYPVPDPNFPFLGVHFTRMINGGVEAGPNAVLAFAREGYKKSDINLRELAETIAWPGFQKVALKYWKTGLGEMYRSFSKTAFTKALQELIPEITSSDLLPGGAGVRAQACDKEGGLLDDFAIITNDHVVNVCNAPSPAATSSLAIGQYISQYTLKMAN